MFFAPFFFYIENLCFILLQGYINNGNLEA